MSKFLDRLFVVISALSFLQLPLFIHVYENQLGGRVAELQWQVQHMQLSAEQSGKSLDLYIQKFALHSDADFSSQGKMMQTIQHRHAKFSKALSSLQQANWLTRPFIFFYYFEKEIGRAAIKGFTPGIPCTWEGAFYACMGIVWGLLLYRLFVKGATFLKRKILPEKSRKTKA